MAAAKHVDDFSFPPSFLHLAKCLVVLTGLDIRNNAIHIGVWDLFKAGKLGGTRKPITYKHQTADHLYPRKVKPVLTEDSPAPPPPSGILKSDWLVRHTQTVPSLVVFFFDLDWDHPQWEEKVMECASKVQVLRSSLEGNSTELCVALIQTVAPAPTGSTEPKTIEQANQLCQACSLPSPNLFIMPYVDRPEGYVKRLEASFYERALSYYSNHAKKIRVVRDMTNRSQQLLSIRRQFKLSYFTELRQDHKEALKLYCSTYKYLKEVMVLSEDRIMEFKMIAGFVNYKICQLMFENNEPKNALGQLQLHLEIFRNERGSESLVFQHMQWMANQFISFGDLFSNAVRKNLNPVQTQHPGIYYYEAVQYLLEKRKIQHSLCKEAYDSFPKPLPSLIPVDYFGQRPWRVGLTDTQPSDSEMRENLINLLQAHEYMVDFSYQICLFLSEARDHFSQLQHKTDNMQTHLTVRLGEEYFITKDYEKCLTLIETVVSAYREKKWWKVLTQLLQIMLKCAYVLSRVQCYVAVTLELLGKFLITNEVEKKQIQDNLNLILQGHPPHPETEFQQNGNESVQDLWYKNLQEMLTNKDNKTIDMSSLASCVECKTIFTDNSYSNDSIVCLQIYFRSTASLPITFNKVFVHLDNPVCNKWCVTNDDVILEPQVIVKLEYFFPALSETFQVQSVDALLGPFKLTWKGGVNGCGYDLQDWNWNKIKNRTSTLILQREPKASLTLEHQSPVLLTELYPVTVKIDNRELKEIKNIKIQAVFLLDEHKTLDGRDNSSIQLFMAPPSDSAPQESSSCVNMSCDSLQSNQELTKTFYVKSSSIGSQKINVSMSYSIDCVVCDDWDTVECHCEKGEIITIETVTPLRLNHKVLNMKFQNVTTLFYDEKYIMQSTVHCMSPWQLTITNAENQWNKIVTPLTTSQSSLKDLTLSQQDTATDLVTFCIKSTSFLPDADQVPLGSFKFTFQRDNTHISTDAKMPLPHITIKQIPYTITAEAPSYAVQHQLSTITYKVTNKTIYIQEYDSQLIASSDFIYSGNKTNHFKVLPMACYELLVNVFPLSVGHVTFPRVEVTCVTQPNLDDVILSATTSSLPTSLFIMPPSIQMESPSTRASTNSLSSSITASL